MCSKNSFILILLKHISNTLLSDTITFIPSSEKLGHIANLDCDMIEEGENVYVIDLNPRFGGGYPATHLSGVNLLSILIKLLEGKDVEPEYDDYKENLLVMKDISLKSVVLD
jgi:carbamoyl-phosphate synthase large subunit